MLCGLERLFEKDFCDVDAFASKIYYIFLPALFFCIKVIVFSCGNKGLKKGYMPVAPFVNFKEMEKPTFFQVFFGMHKVNQKKFAEYENRVEYFQRTIIHHILLGLVYSWLSFDESFGTEDLRVC